MNFKVMARNAVKYTKCEDTVLDWTRESVLFVEQILVRYRTEYSGQQDAKWKLSSFSADYAAYVRELMLKMLKKGLKNRGFMWLTFNWIKNLPVLKNGDEEIPLWTTARNIVFGRADSGLCELYDIYLL